jgi:ribonuclease HI/exonuclease III
MLTFSNSTFLVPRIVTLNLNSLGYYATTLSAKIRHSNILDCLRSLSKGHEVLCLQETGLAGSTQALSASLPHCKTAFSSLKAGTAGVAIVDCPSINKLYSVNTLPLPLALNGHVLARVYSPKDPTKGYSTFQLINCYFPTGEHKANRQLEIIKEIMKLDNRHPTFMCGDFNFVLDAQDTSAKNYAPSKEFRDRWEDLLSKFSMGEAHSDEHTWFRLSGTDTQSARLDRFYIPAFLHNCPVLSPLVASTHLHALYSPPPASSGFTDHVPLSLSFSSTSEDPNNRSPKIPQWVAEDAAFADSVHELVKSTPLHKSPFKALRDLKAIFYKAARQVRKTASVKATLLRTLSAQIRLLKLVSLPSQSLPAIRSHLSTFPYLNECVNFSQGRFHETGLSAAIQVSLASLRPKQQTAPAPNPIQQLKASLPHTQGRLGGLRSDPDEEIHSSHEEMAKIAKTFWGKVWSRRYPPTSHTERGEYLQWYNKSVDPGLLSQPTLDSVRSAILRTRNTSPGPDGVPFAAWRSVPDLAAPVLFGALSLMKGDLPPKGFNFGLLFLIPKKNTHLVSDTRPLSVTNTDNRILARVMAGSIMKSVKNLINPAQKGFLSGVQGTDHIDDLNLRFYEAVVNRKERFVFFLDTAKAFDSIDHAWILAVIRKAKFPQWFINFVQAAIHEVMVSPFFGSRSDTWIDIFRGVKQGCPLSPLLFLLAYDPLIENLASTDFLIPYAFADDLALCFDHIHNIDYPLKAIDAFARISGLGRNTAKSCLISSLSREDDPRCLAYLAGCAWPDLKILAEASYLGLPIGAKVTLEDIFKGPTQKLRERLRILGPSLSTLPLHKKLLLVNVFAVSLFSYVCLFFVMPHELWLGIKEAIRLAITPFHGGAYPYEALVCGGALFGLKPALRDPWAAGISLLAVRSAHFPSPDRPPPPFVDLRHNMFITSHRNSAAHDLSILSDTPITRDSPKVYQAIVKGFFLPTAMDKWNTKIEKHVPFPNSPICTISTNLLSIRSLPPFLSAFFLSLLSNALPTTRRRRHVLHLTREQVPPCLLCGKGEDSMAHLYGGCEVSTAASSILFPLLLLPSSASPTSLADFFLSSPFSEDLRAKCSAATVALAFAIWNFRAKAQAPREELGVHWVTQRVVNLATTTFLSFHHSSSKKTRKREKDIASSLSFICSLDPLTISCYTDGSASPNPGPSGAGTHVQFPSLSDTEGFSVDAGAPLGPGTNNLGELWAVGIALFIVSKHPSIHNFHEVCIFSDSSFAISTLQGKGSLNFHTTARALVTTLLASLRSVIPVRLVWVPGHGGIIGNERADKISCIFSRFSASHPSHTLPSSLLSSLHLSSLPLSDSLPPPFSSAPLSSYQINADKTDSMLGILPIGPVKLATSSGLTIGKQLYGPQPANDTIGPASNLPSSHNPHATPRSAASALPSFHLPLASLPSSFLPPVGKPKPAGGMGLSHTGMAANGMAADCIGIPTLNPSCVKDIAHSRHSPSTTGTPPSPLKPPTNPGTKANCIHRKLRQNILDSFVLRNSPLNQSLLSPHDALLPNTVAWDPG